VSADFIALIQMKQRPDPPSSPDWAPSDFFVFDHVKRMLMGYHTDSLSELLVCIRIILWEIPRETLNAVFLDGMERLQKDIGTTGEDVG
jgi:hypothetical protein